MKEDDISGSIPPRIRIRGILETVMKAFDITKHKTNLTNILIGIYKNSSLAPILGFKGGTAAMLFYKLPRFSVDLNFDLIPPLRENSEQLNNFIAEVTKLLSAKYKIIDQSTKYHTLFWLVSYGHGLTKIKVEISTRDILSNHYVPFSLYGVTIKVMDIKDMIAHKMIALTERKTLANRDLFDTHFFLSSEYAGEINYNIIRERLGKEPKEFYAHLLKFVSKIKPDSVLGGLGEVLTKSQKDWAKTKLVEESKGLIQRQIDLLW